MDELILCEKCHLKLATRSAFGVLRVVHRGLVVICVAGPVEIRCGHAVVERDAAGAVTDRHPCGWPVTLYPSALEVAR